MTVRLKDIANDLNLSQMTISRVLRGHTDVSPETKARVLQRVKELNYRPNVMARGLRTGHTSIMGLIVPSLHDSFFSEVARGIDRAIRNVGYELVICISEDDPILEQRHIELLLAHQVDALLVATIQESAFFFDSLNKGTKVPLIFLNRRLQDDAGQSGFVGIREEDVARVAVEHLANIGCRRIAYLRGPHSHAGDLRHAGFRAALRDAGLMHRSEYVIDGLGAEATEYRKGFDGMLRLLAVRNRPDGLVAYTDMMAIGAIDAARSKGVRIPQEIAVVGSGNEVRICEMQIGLTSVDTAGYEIGQRVGRMAWQNVQAKTTARHLLIGPKLIQRASSTR